MNNYYILGIILVLVIVFLFFINKKEKYTDINKKKVNEEPIFLEEEKEEGEENGEDEEKRDEVDGREEKRLESNYYFLDDGADGKYSVQHNLCSKSCCSPQWPTPFKLDNDPYIEKNKDKYAPSNMYCNNSFQDSGCLCMTKEQSKFIYNRGDNGRTLY